MAGTSSFVELAVAISLLRLNFGTASGTMVAVLVKGPVIRTLVALPNRTRGQFPDRPRSRTERPSPISDPATRHPDAFRSVRASHLVSAVRGSIRRGY